MVETIELKKSTFKKIESEWFDYHRTVKEIALLREEIFDPYQEHKDENIGSSGSNEIGKPTERIATQLTINKQLRYLNNIAKSIEEVYNALPPEYKKLVQLRYWSKNRQLTWDGIGLELNVSKRQAMRWRDEIIQATSEVLGWR